MRGTGILLTSAVVGMSSSARAATSWSFFELSGETQYYSPTPPTSFVVFPIFFPAPGTPISGSYVTPDGRGAGTFSPTSGTGSGENYAGMAALQSETSPVSFTGTMGGSTSTYNFFPDYRGLSQASIPTLAIGSPLTGGTTDVRRPTFSWTDTGSIANLSVQVVDSAAGINKTYNLAVDQTTWTPPFSLVNGSWLFNLRANSATVQLPLNTTLISGPDVGLPTTIAFTDAAARQATFAVVPEPAVLSAAAGIILAMLAIRRPNRRAAH